MNRFRVCLEFEIDVENMVNLNIFEALNSTLHALQMCLIRLVLGLDNMHKDISNISFLLKDYLYDLKLIFQFFLSSGNL